MLENRKAVGRRAYLGTLATAALAGGCLGSGGSETLAVGVVPDVDPDAALDQHDGLASYLGSELGVETDLSTTADYASLVQAMTADEVDLAYFGGVSYVLAHHRADAVPVVVGEKDGATDWHSAFLTHESTGLTGMADVVDQASDLDLVFGDPISTSGTVMPTFYLRTEYDRTPESDFASVTHVGAHDATARTIAGANGDVGALNARIFDELRAQDALNDGVVELWRTPGFPDYPWAVAPTVSEERRDAIKDAFAGLTPDDGSILEQQNVDGYVSVTHDDFTDLNRAVEMAGLLDSEA